MTYVKAKFIIVRATTLTLQATGYVGIYDAKEHTVHASVNIPERTTIAYSVANAKAAWSEIAPTRTDVDDLVVTIRATNPNYETVTATVPLKIMYRPVTVKANPASKVYGAKDPSFSAVVTGLLNDDKVTYTVTRPRAGKDENAGVYANAIVPAGAEIQGNYTVTYEPAKFTITAGQTLVVTAEDYSGVYDGASHQTVASANIPENTTIEYSVDGGVTWTTTPPSITNVGSVTVLVRATNPNYETATASYTLQVTPAAVTVQAHNAVKPYGQPDPEPFTASVTGLLGNDTIEYTVSRPGAGTDENVGVYPGAIVPTGAAEQGNYTVTYLNGDFEITRTTGLTLLAQGYSGVYDAEDHAVSATASTENPADNAATVIEYSVDGGQTWTTEPPHRTDVGSIPVLVRATNPNYEPVEAEVLLEIRPRQVIVTVGQYTKIYGQKDPTFTATVEGLLNDDQIEYTISRTPGEEPGTYAVTPAGDREQGNYVVVYVSGSLQIISDETATPTPEPTETPDPNATPTPSETPDPNATPAPGETPDPNATPEPSGTPTPGKPIPTPTPPGPIDFLEPRGNGRKVWALINLICLIITLYIFLPLLHLGAKFDRIRLMNKINKSKRQLRLLQELNEEEGRDKTRLEQLVHEARKRIVQAQVDARIGDIQADEFDSAVETLFYKVKRFRRRFNLGMILELIFSAVALVLFLLTEDMRLPMVLIDKWTLAMLLLMILVLILDIRFIRYRYQVLADEEEAQRRRLAQERAAMDEKTKE